MTWAAPWALIGLVGLPLAWWWHRRQRRPQTIDLSSLLFLQPELDAQPAHRRVFDPELLFALLAILLLVLAAALPSVVLDEEGRTVRVVVSKGAPAAARGYADRVSEALDVLRGALGASDRLVVIEEPMASTDLMPRPSPGVLRATAQGGDAAFRAVISDADAPSETAGVTWISVGSSETYNVGLVAATVTPGGSGPEVFVNVQGDASRASVVRIVLVGDGQERAAARLEVPAGGYASKTLGLGANALAVEVTLRAEDGSPWKDDLAADDRVSWAREAIPVHVDAGVPDALRQAVEDALLARFGRGGYLLSDRDAVLSVRTQAAPGDDAGWTLVLHPAAAGGAEAPPGVDHAREDALVADLGTGDVGLVYASGVADDPPRGRRVLLWRDAGGRRWPVVAREGQLVHFLPDPTRGRPAPAAMPLWPLFLDNLLAEVTGQVSGAGQSAGRRLGLLDPGSSRLGRTRTAIEPPSLSAAPADRPVRTLALAPWLLVGALLALGLLWGVPWSRVRRKREGRSRPAPPPVPSSS